MSGVSARFWASWRRQKTSRVIGRAGHRPTDLPSRGRPPPGPGWPHGFQGLRRPSRAATERRPAAPFALTSSRTSVRRVVASATATGRSSRSPSSSRESPQRMRRRRTGKRARLRPPRFRTRVCRGRWSPLGYSSVTSRPSPNGFHLAACASRLLMSMRPFSSQPRTRFPQSFPGTVVPRSAAPGASPLRSWRQPHLPFRLGGT